MNPPRAVWVALVLVAMATAAALGYQRESIRLRLALQEQDQQLQAELEGALNDVMRLCEASLAPPSLSGSGETLYVQLSPAPSMRADARPNEVGIYVDKKDRGLWQRDRAGQPRLLAACVDRMDLEVDSRSPVGTGWLVVLSAIHPASGHQASRRSMCRYITYRSKEQGNHG